LVTGLLCDRITNDFGCLNANTESNNGECPVLETGSCSGKAWRIAV